jgi:drug/metabolite transporter (DMT)-like permease
MTTQEPTNPAPAPGWYPNPAGPGQRYWDGTTWTDHVQAASPMLPPPVVKPRPKLTAAYWLGVLALVGMVVGAVGPWITFEGLSVSGTSGHHDGPFVIGLAVVGAILIGIYASNRAGGLMIGAVFVGIVGTIILIADISDISNHSDEGLSAGWGIYVALGSAVVFGVACLVARLRHPA